VASPWTPKQAFFSLCMVWSKNKPTKETDFWLTSMMVHQCLCLGFHYFFLPKWVQNSPSIASGLAVGASVIPVNIKASLLFNIDWSIGRG